MSVPGPAATAPPPSAAPADSAKDRTVVALFSGLAVGGVALIAVAGAGEYSGLAAGAVALLTVGPAAYGGLVFSWKQILAFFASMKLPKDSGAAGSSETAVEDDAQRPMDHRGAPGVLPAGQATVSKEVVASPVVEGAAQPPTESEKEEPSAWALLVEVWEGLPRASAVRCGVVELVRNTPRACAKFPGGCQSLWQWLTRPRWKPFPWRYLPDPLAFAWGALEILFIAPILAVEIIVTVPAMVLLKAEWRQQRFTRLRNGLPELVRSLSRPLGRLVLRDPRNHSYLPWMIFLGIFIPALFFWAMRRHAAHGLEFSTLCIYHLLRVGPRLQFFAHIHTLTHKEGHSHRGFFKGLFRIFNCTTEWWIGPFYGVVPWNYYIAHMKIHHRWHNDVDDVHTNLDLDRTNPLSFLLYTPRFTLYWTGLSPLCLFIKRKEWALIMKLLYGMVAYYGTTALLLWWNPVFCIVYWLFPHMEACVLLCAISYLWHAFVEESDPGNQYVNSVTILDGYDNVWNEDYHVVHHHAPNTHWSDAPAHFEAHRAQYAAVTATIFRDTEEGKLLQWLFEQNWDAMAEHFVDLNGKLTHEEKKSLIVRRLSVIVGEKGRDGKRKEWAATSTIRDFTE